MNNKRLQVKRQVTSLLLAILVLAAAAAPVLAEFDAGEGQGEYRPASMTAKYPAGMLKAELP